MRTTGTTLFLDCCTLTIDRFNPVTRKIELNEIPIPQPQPHEVLVKIKCASLCHSDVMLFAPNDALQMTKDAKPITMGHEATGVVAGVGSDITAFKEGDPVGFICAEQSCFECHPCKNV
jgi:alcohol dehydrogenase, propanol-preferring